MSLRIYGQVGVGITLGGGQIPLAMGGVKEVYIVQNVKAMLPQFKLTVLDYDGTIHNAAPSDGTKVGITLDDGQGRVADYRFRCFGGPVVEASGAALQFTMSGTLDAMPYLREHVSKAYKDQNASDVVAKIASQSGLRPIDIDQTMDKMTWLPQPLSFAKYTQHVTQHAFRGAQSLMATAVTEGHGFMFKDVTQAMNQGPTACFYNGVAPTGAGRPLRILHWTVLSQAGVLNHMFGYGTKIIQEQMTGAADIFNKFSASMMNGSLGMSKDLMGSLNVVRNAYVPPDVGNTHKNYMKARYQNLRGAATFVGKMEVVLNYQSGVELYDTVCTSITVPNLNRVSEVYSQKFLVTAKTRFMRENNEYYEKIELSNQGISSQESVR